MSTDQSTATPVAENLKNPAGRVSLMAGIVLALIATGQQVYVNLAPVMSAGNIDYTMLQVVLGAFGIVMFVVALLALALGIVGLTRVGLPKAAAAAGAALGAWGVVSGLVNFALSSILNLLY